MELRRTLIQAAWSVMCRVRTCRPGRPDSGQTWPSFGPQRSSVGAPRHHAEVKRLQLSARDPKGTIGKTVGLV